MAAAPRYAFITLDPAVNGTSKRDLFFNLSQYGDVKLMSKVSEVACLFTDLVRNLEIAAGEPRTIFVTKPPAVDLPPRRVRTTTRCLPVATVTRQAAPVPIPPKPAPIVIDYSIMPEPLPRPPPGFSSQPTLNLPDFGSSSESCPKEESSLDKTAKTEEEIDEMISNFKSEEDLINGGVGKEGMDDDFDPIDSKDGLLDEKYEDEDNMKEPGSSAVSASVADDVDGEELGQFVDEDGDIEMPYNPQFQECRPRRPLARPIDDLLDRSTASQAQCAICRRWVKITNTCTRLIAHVFMHTKKERYMCPVDDCEYSNKNEVTTRRHINSVHGQKTNPVDIEKDKRSLSRSWKSDRCKWAPRCFPDHFSTAPGGSLFMKINEKTILMEGDNF